MSAPLAPVLRSAHFNPVHMHTYDLYMMLHIYIYIYINIHHSPRVVLRCGNAGPSHCTRVVHVLHQHDLD